MIRTSILALMLSATSVFAQSQCGPVNDALAWLQSQHYVVKAAGNIEGGKVAVFVNDTADWIIIAMNAEAACVLQVGKDWALEGADT